MVVEDAAAEEDVAVGDVAVELGEEGVEVVLGLELAVYRVTGLAGLDEGNGVVEGVGDGVEEVEGERVSVVWELGGEIGEVSLEVSEFDSGEGPLAFEVLDGGDFVIEEGREELEGNSDGVCCVW